MRSRILLVGAQNPAHPWWQVAERVVERLVGFHEPLLPGARLALVTPPNLQGARSNPVEVATGALDVGITTPSVAAAMARAGTGVYAEPAPSLRALAVFPHIDCVVFAIDARTGIESFEQLVETRYPLRLVTGRRSKPGDDDVLTFAVDAVLRAYGASYADIESWGGSITYGGPTHIGGRLLLDDDGPEALFHEARTQPIWRDIAERRDLNFLEVGREALDGLRAAYGFSDYTIEPGAYRGVDRPVQTLDFSGWLLFCRDDLPDEQAYAIASACAATARNELPSDVTRSLQMPIDLGYMFGETVVPLHPGAEAYAREHGHLRAEALAG